GRARLVGKWAQQRATAPGYHGYDALPRLIRPRLIQRARWRLHGLDAVWGRGGNLQLVGALEGVLMSGKYQVYPHVVERLQGGATGLLVPRGGHHRSMDHHQHPLASSLRALNGLPEPV